MNEGTMRAPSADGHPTSADFESAVEHRNRSRHVVPLISSAGRKWRRVSAELYQASEVDVVAPFPEHTVSMHFKGGVDLVQTRHGRTRHTRLRAGDVMVTAAGEPKTLRHEQQVEVLKVRLAPELVADVVREGGLGPVAREPIKDSLGTRDADLAYLCRHFRAELEHESMGSRLHVDALAIQLTLHLLRHYSDRSHPVQRRNGTLPAHKLRRAIDYMTARLDADLTLENIANELSMSAFHFAHLFKQTTGLSPHRYLIELRLERARSLLRDTNLSITDIAQQVGYLNNSHFAVAFHRATGVTPRQYRRDA